MVVVICWTSVAVEAKEQMYSTRGGGRTGGGGIQRACFVVVKASYQLHLITYIGLAFLYMFACSYDVATGVED